MIPPLKCCSPCATLYEKKRPCGRGFWLDQRLRQNPFPTRPPPQNIPPCLTDCFVRSPALSSVCSLASLFRVALSRLSLSRSLSALSLLSRLVQSLSPSVAFPRWLSDVFSPVLPCAPLSSPGLPCHYLHAPRPGFPSLTEVFIGPRLFRGPFAVAHCWLISDALFPGHSSAGSRAPSRGVLEIAGRFSQDGPRNRMTHQDELR